MATPLKFAGSAMGFGLCGKVSHLKSLFRWRADEFLFNAVFSNTPSNPLRRSHYGRPASMGAGMIFPMGRLLTKQKGMPRF